MRSILKKTFQILAQSVSMLIPFSVFALYDRFFKTVVWYSARRKFGSVGKDSYIEWPFLVHCPGNIHIGNNFSALTQLRIETFNVYGEQTFSPKLVIGSNVSFNNDCHIGCINRVEIGNNVLGASRIYITDHYHGSISKEDLITAPGKRPLHSKGPVIIKDNVWIGEGVVILPNVIIGENAIIGANSVVNKDVPANAVVAGTPAKVIKVLF
jgi:acetyltransferase-like isoleucine patch superfamily enzyme